MALTAAQEATNLQHWERNYLKEFLRENHFSPYMGKGSNNPIIVKRQTINGGETITIPLVYSLGRDYVGTGTLSGNETPLDHASYVTKPYWVRHGVKVKESEDHKSVLDLYNAARDELMRKDKEILRFGVIDALSAVAVRASAYNEEAGHGQQVTYAEATATERNTYCGANASRLLFGDSIDNYSGTMGTALGNITSSMKMGAEEVMLMKRQAKARNDSTGRYSVTPTAVKGQGREYFCLFSPSNIFPDLKTDEKIYNANKDARSRGLDSNPIFQDGDLIYDGVIIKEVPEILSTGTVGASGQNVAPAYMVGAQALAMSWGKDPSTTKPSETDHGFIKGLGRKSLWSVEKLFFGGLQHGMVTGFFAAGADLS